MVKKQVRSCNSNKINSDDKATIYLMNNHGFKTND